MASARLEFPGSSPGRTPRVSVVMHACTPPRLEFPQGRCVSRLERLWESLSRTPSNVPLTLAQVAELDRRSEALDRDVAKQNALGVPWDEVVRQLRTGR